MTSVSIPDSSKRFGYVCFKSPEEAKKGIELIDGKTVKGQVINVMPHMKKAELMEKNPMRMTNYTSNLFLSGVPEGVTEKRLKDIFAQWGEVTSVSVKSDRDTAYVCYENAKMASDAIYQCALRSPFPETSQFNVDYFKPKELREK